MNKNVNSIVICKDQYNSQEEFENAIKKAIMVLLDNDCIMTVRYDEKGLGIVCIEFDSADTKYGGNYPIWLSSAEYESVVWDDEKGD